MKIYKYPIKLIPGFEQRIESPPLGRAIHAGLDPTGQACIWAEVDETGETFELRDMRVILAFTGQERPDRAFRHLSSFSEGPLMYHVYVRPSPR